MDGKEDRGVSSYVAVINKCIVVKLRPQEAGCVQGQKGRDCFHLCV